MKPDIWMPLYIGDYLADTTHLSATEHGAYLLLLMSAWTRGGTLPDDDAMLCRMARIPANHWSRIREILRPFFTIEGGTWVQKRLQAELQKASTVQESCSLKAAHAATSRWQKVKEKQGKADARSISQAMLQNAPSPSPSEKTLKPSSSPAADEGFAVFWSAYPRRIGKHDAQKAWAKLRPDEVMRQRMLRAIAFWRAMPDWLRDDGAFIPHPATWLNGRRWEDEPTILRAPEKKVAL